MIVASCTQMSVSAPLHHIAPQGAPEITVGRLL